MIARIYSPAKTAAQSGKKRTGYWVLRYEPQTAKMIEPLMGYTSATDMQAEVELHFDTKQEAVSFADRGGIPYEVEEPNPVMRQQVSYANNFRNDRKMPWTH